MDKEIKINSCQKKPTENTKHKDSCQTNDDLACNHTRCNCKVDTPSKEQEKIIDAKAGAEALGKGFMAIKSSQPKEDWINKFYDLYEDGRKNDKAPITYIDFFKARYFITDLLKTQKAELEGKIESENLKSYKWGRQDVLKELEASLPKEEEMVAEHLDYGDTVFQSNAVRYGKNEYRSEVLELLKKIRT